MHKPVAAIFAGMLALAGCAAGQNGDMAAAPRRQEARLLVVLASTSTPDESRKAADRRLVEIQGQTNETRLAVLEQILYAPGHSDAMRQYAMDRLAQADPNRAANALMLYLPQMDGMALAHACGLAVNLGDPRVVEALLLSLDRPKENADTPATPSPEAAAIEALSGKKLEAVLLAELEQSPYEAVRVAALDVSRTRWGEKELLARLANLHGGAANPWIDDLQKYAAAFDCLPQGPNEVLWARFLRRPENAELLAATIRRHRLLKSQADYRFAPRFAAVLAYADDPAVAMTRPELLADLRQRLDHLPHVKRQPEYPGSPDDKEESLQANEKLLTRGDLLVLRMILRGLEDPATVQELALQGRDDLHDTLSEHGGLLAMRGGGGAGFVPRLYPSMFAANDFQYVTGDKLLRDTVTGLAEYHFHFQQVHNEERAGPGAGDLAYIKQARCNGVVITSVGPQRMDVDYYTPSGAVVDLGVYEAK